MNGHCFKELGSIAGRFPARRTLGRVLQRILLLFVPLSGLFWNATAESTGRIEHFKRATKIEHGIVRHAPDEFCGWPANHGVWSWDGGREILVGFTSGPFVEQEGHKIGSPQRDMLARSLDGGETWTLLNPDGYVEPGQESKALDEPIDFHAPGFVLRVKQVGPRFYYSYDKGDTWRGPFFFNGLDEMPELKGMALSTPRTDYQVRGRGNCILLLSAAPEGWADRTFAVKTTDGGMTFSFVSWVIGPDDPYRAVMPQTVALSSREYLSLIRRRDRPGRDVECWIDAYSSSDRGQSWSFRSRVSYTGFGNSNGSPPAVIRLADGRLLAAYANRSLNMLLCRLSADDGHTWGAEIILRDDFLTRAHGFSDFGYPRLVERDDGRVVAIYYFATDERYQQHIACSIFSLDAFEAVEIRRAINPAP